MLPWLRSTHPRRPSVRQTHRRPHWGAGNPGQAGSARMPLTYEPGWVAASWRSTGRSAGHSAVSGEVWPGGIVLSLVGVHDAPPSTGVSTVIVAEAVVPVGTSLYFTPLSTRGRWYTGPNVGSSGPTRSTPGTPYRPHVWSVVLR